MMSAVQTAASRAGEKKWIHMNFSHCYFQRKSLFTQHVRGDGWRLSKVSYLLQEGKICWQPDTLALKRILLMADPHGALH